ncbi:MAG TPA: DNA cytosine methyltransferase [Gallicola sp.]|nr:DNA cytosine methyltransferase [Gallicola sp.]
MTNNNYDAVEYIDIRDLWNRDGWNNPKERTNLNFIDLFSGAGGLSCGLVMAGFNPIANVEMMPEAVETFKYNFKDIKGFAGRIESRDITEQTTKEGLYEEVKGRKIDLIAGGFPCQGFSMAGKRALDDPRNYLYKEMFEIVNHLKPDFVIMENVAGLRSFYDGKIEKSIINAYEEIGYKINVSVLNSVYYGVPQIRKRVIFIGNRIDKKIFFPKPLYNENNFVTIGDAILKYMDMPETPKINHIFTKHNKNTIERLKNVPEGGSLYPNYSDSWKKSPWDKPSCTIKENHGGVNIHPRLPRVLTPRELAELQSFPDDFIFKGSKKWQLVQIGNAVPPLLGKAIGLAVRKSLQEK